MDSTFTNRHLRLESADREDLTVIKLLEALRHYRKSSGWIEITNPVMKDSITGTYGIELNRTILHSVTLVPRTIMDILSTCNIPQTTGYRRILKLIRDQYLIPVDTVCKAGSKKARRYISTIRDLQIEIKENRDVLVRVRFQHTFSQNQDEFA